MTAKTHSFNTDLAKIVGLKEAIILSHIYFWYEQNSINNKNFHDGTYWTFNSVKTFQEQFDYMTYKEIRNVLEKLEAFGWIVSGNYNKIKIDKTKWYTVTENTIALFKGNTTASTGNTIAPTGKWSAQTGKRDASTGKAIPDINTDINSNINIDTPISPKGDLDEEEFYEEEAPIDFDSVVSEICFTYAEKTKNELKPDAVRKNKGRIIKLFNMGYTMQDIRYAMINISKDEWQINNNYPYLSLNKLFSVDIIQRFKSVKPKTIKY